MYANAHKFGVRVHVQQNDKAAKPLIHPTFTSGHFYFLGLGALTHAITEFEGGVIIISHNREFANAVGEEKWIMEAGHLRKEGESANKDEEVEGNKVQEEIRDAAGNIIDQAENLALKDVKVLKKELKAMDKKIKEHKKKGYPEDDESPEFEFDFSAAMFQKYKH